jgi:hypothetical protein
MLSLWVKLSSLSSSAGASTIDCTHAVRWADATNDAILDPVWEHSFSKMQFLNTKIYFSHDITVVYNALVFEYNSIQYIKVFRKNFS